METEAMEPRECAMVARPSFTARLWRALGFHFHEFPDVSPEAEKLSGWLRTDIYLSVSILDRLRLLVTGRAFISVETHTDIQVTTAISVSRFMVKPPFSGDEHRLPAAAE